jgi:hypothetical protein
MIMGYSYKTCHRLNAHILAPILFKPKYENRGKFNRMWRKGEVNLDQLVHQLYKHYVK